MPSEPAQVVCEIEDLVQARLQKQNRQEQRCHELRERNWIEQIVQHVNGSLVHHFGVAEGAAPAFAASFAAAAASSGVA